MMKDTHTKKIEKIEKIMKNTHTKNIKKIKKVINTKNIKKTHIIHLETIQINQHLAVAAEKKAEKEADLVAAVEIIEDHIVQNICIKIHFLEIFVTKVNPEVDDQKVQIEVYHAVIKKILY